jgi:hypothetical protein
MTRPILSRSLDDAEFSRWYWLKSELQAFCRDRGFSASGSKADLENRVRAILAGQEPPKTLKSQRVGPAMPTEFTAETVIGSGWKCSQCLRSYFVSVHGQAFSFNAALREFIATEQGKTLADASARYASTRNMPAGEISRQFEYNLHMREFFSDNPGSTHRQAVDAWWAKRSKADAKPLA